MKTNYKIFTIGLIISFLYIFSACKKEDNTFQSSAPYLFRPINFTVSTNKTIVTLTWAPVDSAQSYTVQISQDSLLFQNIIITDSVTTTAYVVELGGNTRYSARIKANARKAANDSKYNETITFKTPSENIFGGYNSYMFDQGSAELVWLPTAEATKLVFSAPGKTDVQFDITSDEVSVGKKACTGLTNGTYTVSIYNGQFLRGTTTLAIEGDVWVNPGDNLSTALASVTKDSSVVILKPGSYGIGSAVTSFTQNIKIRGLYKDTLSTVYMTSGATGTANMFNINTTNPLSYIRLENIDFSGYVDNISGGIKIGYLFNQSTAVTLNELSFTNCIISDIGNTPVRLKDAPIKTIQNLTFNGCRISDIGYSSVYAVVNNNVAGCVINNISFINSTVYNFAGSLVLHTTGNSNSVLLQNCTFNEITTSGTGTSIRYIIDYTTNYTVNNGVTIQNCIFGSTPRPYTDGVRVSAATNKQISGSYATSDYKDNNATPTTYSIVGSLTAYPGLSTDLFTAPTSGDFTFKDNSFAGLTTAGDPRWWTVP
jgi:hypothetical protein